MTGPAAPAVVFDLFHTLADPEAFRPPDFDRKTEAAHALGVPRHHFVEFWEATVDVLAVTPTSVDERIRAHWEQRGKPIDPDRIAAAVEAIGRHQDAALLHPLPEVLAGLSTLRARGAAMVVLSNCHERDVRRWDESPLAPYFVDALFSCRTGLAKPTREAFTVATTRLGVAASSAAFVGDGGSDELAGAQAAGFGLVVCVTGLALKSGFRTQADLDSLMKDADVAIDGIEHLPRLLTAPLAPETS